MLKFSLFEEVFWKDSKEKVKIVKICPTIKGVPQSYEFISSKGNLIRDVEHNFYKSSEVFPNAVFRVEEIVYFISNTHDTKSKKLKVVDIFVDKDNSSLILYKCIDNDNNEFVLTPINLSLYPNTHFIR